MSLRSSIVLLALVACDTSSGGVSAGPKTAESGTKRGSAGGFSQTVMPELVKGGVVDQATATAAMTGTAKPEPVGTAKPEPAGSAAKPEPAGGSKPEPAGSAGKPEPAGTAPKPEPAGSAAKPEPAGSGGKPEPAGSAAKPAGASATPTKIASRAYVKPAGELGSIKFDLEPNWERDMGEAGTFSLVVKVPNSDDSRVFSVRYGLEDQAAPVDCDQYRKFLEDKKVMTVTLNRQRGGACYIEGTEGSAAQGATLYRYLLIYGGKRLICQGSLYKDATSLGDLRDKVLMQAKKICETLAL